MSKYERTIFENDTTVDAAQVLNKFDEAIYDLYKKVHGETVWENADTTAVFNAQDVVVTPSENVTHYEIQFMCSNSVQYLNTTGKVPIGNNTHLVATGGSAKYRKVDVAVDSATPSVTFTFSTGYSGTSAGTGNCVPARIILYYE